MPLVNRAPIDATGKMMVTTTVPTAAWPSLGGMTYHPTTGELAVIDAVPAAADPWVGGIRFTNLGSMYVWSAAMPAGVEFIGGIPVTDDGRVVVGTGTPIYGVGGWPIDASGGVSVGSGLAPVPIFFAPLTNSLIPTTAGNPTFTFARATTAYAMDQDGILRQSIANEARFQGARRVRNLLLTTSENFSNGIWTKDATTSVTGGQTDPLGGNTAYQIANVTATHGIYQSLGTTVTNACASIWLRGNVGGEVVQIGSTAPAVTVVLTAAWQRYSTFGATAAFFVIRPQGAGVTVFAWRAQLEDVSGASNQAPGEYVSVGVLAAPYHGNAVDGVKYFPTTNGNSVAANVVTEATGTPIPLATTLGYVAENAATNLCLQSQTFDVSSNGWNKNQSTITANTQAAPDGTSLTADTFTDDTAPNIHSLSPNIQPTVTSGQPYTFSVYAKAGTLSWMNLVIQSGTFLGARFNLQAGVLGTVDGGITAQMVVLPNGWYRCSITGTAGAATLSQQIFSAPNGSGNINPVYVGTGQTMYLWGAQLEQASDASSYIPTTTASVTRNGDALTYPVLTNVSGVVGTAYTETYHPVAANSDYQIVLRWVDPNATPQYFANTSSKFLRTATAGGDIPTANQRVLGTVNKNANGWSGATVSVCLNGGAVATGAYTANPNTGNINVVSAQNGGQSIQGSIRNVKFYATRLTDVEIQQMTT